MKKHFLVLGIVLLFLIASCTQTQPAQPALGDNGNSGGGEEQTSGSYKIGVMLPLTGDGAAYGLPIRKSLQIAVDEINANGGVNGKKLEPVYQDSKCNPKDGNAAAQTLINIDKVKVIIGGICSGETLGAASLANDN